MTSTINNHRRQAASQSMSPTSNSPSPLSSSRQEATSRGLGRSRQTNNYRQKQQQQQHQRQRPNHLHTEEDRPHQQERQGSSMGGAAPETQPAQPQPRPRHVTLPLSWDPANRANFRTVRRDMLRAIFCDDADVDAGHPPANPSMGPAAAAVPFARSQSVSASNCNSTSATAATATTATGGSAGVRGPANRTDYDLAASGKPILLGRSHSVSALPTAKLPDQTDLWLQERQRQQEQDLIQKQERETASLLSMRAKAKLEALLPPPRDYFSSAVRHLLLEGPLPLVEVEPLDDHVHDWNRDDHDDVSSRNPVITNPAVAAINATASATAATITSTATAAAITTITNSPKKKEGTSTNKFKTSQYHTNIQQQQQQHQRMQTTQSQHAPQTQNSKHLPLRQRRKRLLNPLRPIDPIANNTPSVVLLSRPYFRQWCHWARGYIVNTDIHYWLSTTVTSLMNGIGAGAGIETIAGDGKSIPFTLSSHAIRTLAALSIVTDQYPLWSDDDEINGDANADGETDDEGDRVRSSIKLGTNGKKKAVGPPSHEWVQWLDSLRDHWNHCRCQCQVVVAENQSSQFLHYQQQSQLQPPSRQQPRQHPDGQPSHGDGTKTIDTNTNTNANATSLPSSSSEHTQQDEKKNDDDVVTSSSLPQQHQPNHPQHPQYYQQQQQQQQQQFHQLFVHMHPPGPIDSRMLSSFGRPLQLRRNVAIVHKGIAKPSTSLQPMKVADEQRDDYLFAVLSMACASEDHRPRNYEFYLEPNETDDNDDDGNDHDEDDDDSVTAPQSNHPGTPPRFAACPVPTPFYEMLRSHHGVICEDGRSISFQPGGVGGANGSGAGNGNGNGSGGGTASGNGSTVVGVDGTIPTCLLHHDQWSLGVTAVGAATGAAKAATKNNVDIQHPSLASSSGSAAHGPHVSSNASTNVMSIPSVPKLPRPIEFRRRVLPVQSSTPSLAKANGSSKKETTLLFKTSPEKTTINYTTPTASSTMSPSLHTSSTTDCIIETHPIEFRYSIIDGTVSNPPSPLTVSLRHTHEGMALASRDSIAGGVLRDLERAAAPHRSSSCVRLWMRSPAQQLQQHGGGSSGVVSGRRGATLRGDGYDLIDMEALSPKAARPVNGKVNESLSSSSKSGNAKQPMTVAEWLHLEERGLGLMSKKTLLGPVVVELLIEIRSSPTARWSRESLESGNRWEVGDFVDAQDTALKWYEGIIREVTADKVKVHYFGWASKWDATLPRYKNVGTSKLSPPAPLWTKTSRWRERIKVGDSVEVRESNSLAHRPKWYRATVLAIGKETDSPRELTGGAELEMNEENEKGAKNPLLLLNRTRQILVRVPQEKNNCPPLPIPKSPMNPDDSMAVRPPYIRWVNLYGEEICEANTHISPKEQTNTPATVTYAMESERQPVEVMKSFNNIHGAGFVRESLRGVPPAPGAVGLHNLGNSCYLNSILQCINHIEPITQYFLKGHYIKEINKNNPLGSGGRVATAYASFLNDVWAGEYSIIAPRLMKQVIGSFAPQFNNNFQHDSQEFCQFLMDGLHEDLNRVKSKPYVEHMEAFGMEDSKASIESWKKHLLRHDSIFVDHTQGMHRSHLTCPKCGKESIKFDVYSSISLPLVPSKDRPSIPLQDCLDQFAAGEQLDDHNAWYCSRCKKHVCALKLITLWNTPDVLVLHLKRFTFEKCPVTDKLLRKKIEDTVDFPIERLDLSSYVLGPKFKEAPPIYKLFGVSEHTGSTANSGHYTATVRNSRDGKWYRYNDSHVGSTSGEAAVTGGAYLLFYQRVKGSLRWAGMEKQMTMVQQPQLYRQETYKISVEEDADGFREVRKKGRKKKY